MNLIRGELNSYEFTSGELNSYEFKSGSELNSLNSLNSFNSFNSFNSWRTGEGHVPQELNSKSDLISYDFNSEGIKFT